MHLVRALLYLRWTATRNVVQTRLRRLRQPKYLLGALAAAVYFWFFFLRNSGPSSPAQAMSLLFSEGRAEIIAAVVLSVFLFLAWLVPGDQPGLSFNEAEVAFLFPAPLTRRQLIHYKLLDGLALTLFGALFFSLISGGFRSGFGGSARHLAAWWSLNANLSLHQPLAALAIARLSAYGLRATRRRVLLAVAGVAIVTALITVAVRSGPGALEWMLWPARLAVRPFLALGPAEFVLALAPAIGLVMLQYFIVLQLETPFEDASLARAKKTGEITARMRAGQNVVAFGKIRAKRAPFALARWMPVEAAFLWKNLLSAPSYLNRRVFAGVAVFSTALSLWLQRHPEFDGPTLAAFFGFLGLVFLVYLLIFGPQLARNDLRGDLLNADMFKVYPLPGWRIVLGSMLAPTVILTAIGWLLLLPAVLGLPPPNKLPQLDPALKYALAGSIAFVLPALCAVQLLVPNAATLVFPAWAQVAKRAAGGGIDVMGQRLIFFVGQLFCLLLALVPAGLAAAVPLLGFWLVGWPAAIVLAALAITVVLAIEVWLGVLWLGPKFERLDISAELRP